MTTHHYVELTVEGSELHRRFRCDAPEDAFCRRRPPRHAETGQESWTEEEAEVPGHNCWAEEWCEAIGIDDALFMDAADGVLASVPVDISYDEGISAAPVREDAEWGYAVRNLSTGEVFEPVNGRWWRTTDNEEPVRRRKAGPWEPVTGDDDA